MPGYRRFIAYVYEYVQGKKGGGKGFIKVEARNGVCRMNFKLRGIPERESVEVSAYGYVRLDNSARGIFLGKGNLAGSQAEFDLEMKEEQMGGSNYSLGDLGGLLLLGENGEIYASGWDEQPVRPDRIMLPATQKEAEEKPSFAEKEFYERDAGRQTGSGGIQEEGEARKKAAEESKEVWEETAEENRTDWKETAEENGEACEEAAEENREVWETAENENRENGKIVPETEEETAFGERAEEDVEEEPVPPKKPDGDPGYGEKDWNTVRIADESALGSQEAASSKSFLPFSDEEITDCRKVTPAELRILGRRDRGLVNNNFLRYGAKNYGHLLIGKRREDGRYILGVPGIYERQESLMASMFGFPYFKEGGNFRERRGRFGYWYRLIDTPQL